MISNEEFKKSLGRFASGVTVVTTKDKTGKLHGLTVSAFCSVSMNPPLVLVCIHKETGSHHAFVESKAFVVNILSEKQQDVSNHFAAHSDDKFAGQNYVMSETDLPVLNDCLVNLECVLKNAFDGGDHTIFVGEIEKTTVHDGQPLAYFQGKYRQISE